MISNKQTTTYQWPPATNPPTHQTDCSKKLTLHRCSVASTSSVVLLHKRYYLNIVFVLSLPHWDGAQFGKCLGTGIMESSAHCRSKNYLTTQQHFQKTWTKTKHMYINTETGISNLNHCSPPQPLLWDHIYGPTFYSMASGVTSLGLRNNLLCCSLCSLILRMNLEDQTYGYRSSPQYLISTVHWVEQGYITGQALVSRALCWRNTSSKWTKKV